MPPRLSQYATIALAAGLAAGSVIIMTFGILQILPRALRTPADMLPAEQTIVVIENMDTPTAVRWTAALPILRDAPVTSGATVALLQVGPALEWVALERRAATDPDPSPFRIRAASAAAGELLKGDSKRLSGDATYALLSREDVLGAPRVLFLRPHASLPGARAAIISGNADRFLVAALPAGPLPDLARGGLPEPVVRDAATVIALTDPQAILHGLSAILPEETAMVLEGLIEKSLESILGNAISTRYDLVPLLAAAATLETGAHSGTVVILQGTGGEDLDARLAAMEERAAIDAVTVERRTLGNFLSVEAKLDPMLLDERSFEENGWSVRLRVRKDTGKGFCIAEDGDAFLLSNDRDACLAAVRGDRGRVLPSSPAMIAGGFLSTERVQALKALRLPGVAELWNAVPEHDMQWMVERTGNLLRLTTKKMESLEKERE